MSAAGYAGPERFTRAKGPAPRFHDDPAVDDLLRALVALTAEVAVLRERLDTHERLAAAGALPAAAAVEAYEPDDASVGERATLRQRTIERVLGALHGRADAAMPLAAGADDGGTDGYARVIAQVEGE